MYRVTLGWTETMLPMLVWHSQRSAFPVLGLKVNKAPHPARSMLKYNIDLV